MNNNDTIFALSSGAGKSGVALIRVAGDDLTHMARAIIGRDNVTPRHAYFVRLSDGDELIDECVVTYFAAPHSFTGTDVIEIATHGAPAVIARVFEYLRNRFGARVAMPGEFCRRAFYNNKMDLADVDALAALLDARTEKQRKYAMHAMTGDSDAYNAWRADMIEIAAYAAAILDYNADDLPANIGEILRARIEKLQAALNTSLAGAGAARAIRDGFNIVIAGPTNAGKSSLFNKILGANRAIVSDIPGTTRDVVSATLDIDGYLVNLSDTAGVRDTDDKIEKIGIEKTQSEIENADLIINMGDALGRENEIIVIGKSDVNLARDNKNAIYISAKTGDGIDELMRVVRDRMHATLSGAESAVTVNARTAQMLCAARDALAAAVSAGENYDIVSEYVRAAADAIGQILGTITVAEVLDKTFGQLCLGK